MENDEEYRTPGQLIADLLAARDWTKRVLAIVLGIDETGLNKIVAGKRAVDAELALALGDVFDVPPERFLRLQQTFDLAQARLVARPDPKRSTRAHLFGGLPVAEMIKRSWIDADDVRDVARVEHALTKFFGAASVDQIEILPHAAKKTEVLGHATPTQLAWLYRVKTIASEMLVPRYSPPSARDAVADLHRLLLSPEESRKAPRILAECGVRYLIVETLPGAKIDGVCFWLNPVSPVIAMTLRHDRMDNFWFVLRHEIEHMLREHGRGAAMLDSDLESERASDSITEEEQQANAAASEFCVPQLALERFIVRKNPFFAERDILGFAKTHGIHPGLVAGQLQHRTGRFDRFRQHQARIRAHISPSAIVDGWGDVAPTDG